MTAQLMNIPLTEEQEIVHMLARAMYVQFSESKFANKPMTPPPFCPEWAYGYADLALRYLGHDEDTIDRLRDDYK